MRPAFSVIFLTTLIGVGQGMFIALFSARVFASLTGLELLDANWFYGVGSGCALLFMGAGLFASFFHLTHPGRGIYAWRRWRSSWLSREVILLPMVMVVMALSAMSHFFAWDQFFLKYSGVDLTWVLSGITVLLCILLFIATGMIYASVRFFQEWATPLTVINYLLMGLASGYTLAAVFAHTGFSSGYSLGEFLLYNALLFTVLAWASKFWALSRNRRLQPNSSMQSAIGVHHGTIRQLTRGFTASSFNVREFFHGRTPATLFWIQRLFLTFSFILPVILLLVGSWLNLIPFIYSAFVVQMLGLLLERWYFFAQARHPQNLYYQNVA
ncbi:MAG: dimethyl sulfoxide reductase anchor subunit [Magnetococcales bacterium]|nr:dimethyl sulfoxide reductase anchor subunit [Magnetococcales bacterium]